MSSLFDPEADPSPINRTMCLATRWFDDDPMPHICAMRHGHDGEHGTKPHAVGAGYVTAVNWHNDEEVA